MSFDINILVNGNRCKQYNHQGKTFIQANNGSEYVIQINNNYWKRILAVGSVDGLNILTGKSASEKDTGYIIGAHSSEKIKGFRFSDSEWAMFKFGYKFNGNTYAQSKGDGSEKNCGVIGIRLFYEKEPTYACCTQPTIIPNLYNATRYCCNTSDLKSRNNDICCDAGDLISVNPEFDMGTKWTSDLKSRKPEFDMGTEWGRKEQSKVLNTPFEHGNHAQSFDIYYSSRETLIAMGVPMFNELQVGLPQSFPNEYATPPKNWQGY